MLSELVVSNINQALPSLKNWYEEKLRAGLDPDVVFGSGNKSAIAYVAGVGSAWSNIPLGLEAKLQEKADSPTQVALGTGGAYYVRWSKGGCNYALSPNYPSADEIIDDAGCPPEVRTAASPNANSQEDIIGLTCKNSLWH